jgi:iron complex transport system permease protein
MTIAGVRRLERPVDRTSWVAVALAGFFVVAFFASIAIGAVSLSLADVVSALAARFSSETRTAAEALNEAVVWDLRLARVLTAMIVGASLATCGAAMQGLFGNPSASPAARR